MDQGLYATWIGTAMTALTAATGFLACIFPDHRVWFVVAAVVFSIVALYSFGRAVQARRSVDRAVSLSKGLRLKQWPSHAHGHEVPERTKFELAASEDLRGKTIRVTCDGPIYVKDFVPQYPARRWEYKLIKGSHSRSEDGQRVIYGQGDKIKLTKEQAASKFDGRVAVAQDTSIPDGEPWLAAGEHAQKEDIRHDDMDAVIFDFSSERLAARPFMVILGEVGSITPIRITHVEWVETRATDKPTVRR